MKSVNLKIVHARACPGRPRQCVAWSDGGTAFAPPSCCAVTRGTTTRRCWCMTGRLASPRHPLTSQSPSSAPNHDPSSAAGWRMKVAGTQFNVVLVDCTGWHSCCPEQQAGSDKCASLIGFSLSFFCFHCWLVSLPRTEYYLKWQQCFESNHFSEGSIRLRQARAMSMSVHTVRSGWARQGKSAKS